MRVYLDNCCFNRPYDDQTPLKIKLETQAKLSIQKMVLDNKLELVWSFILSYENSKNPSVEKRKRIADWRKIASVNCGITPQISEKSRELMEIGLRLKDSLHVACAIFAKADYFISTDRGILNKKINEVAIINPVEFIFLTEGRI